MGAPKEAHSPDPEAAYYRTIEEVFVARRGDPLFLSNPDWLLIRRWRVAGIPLRIVLRGIADALDGHAHSWSRDRKVGSLAYCAAEVDAAAKRWRRAVAVGAEEGTDVPSLLRGLAESLGSAEGLDAATGKVATRLAGELEQRAEEPGEPEGLQRWLATCEQALCRALRRAMGKEAVASLESAVDADLAPYRSRMPARVLGQIRAEAMARCILEKHGLPRLALFPL